jgi:hypothetical protein
MIDHYEVEVVPSLKDVNSRFFFAALYDISFTKIQTPSTGWCTDNAYDPYSEGTGFQCRPVTGGMGRQFISCIQKNIGTVISKYIAAFLSHSFTFNIQNQPLIPQWPLWLKITVDTDGQPHIEYTYTQQYRLAICWRVQGSNPDEGEIFRTLPDRYWGPPSLLYNGYWVSFLGDKAARAYRWPPTPMQGQC